MGKLKPRIKAGKGKKWAKGQSSSSNPTITKFREAARSRFFAPNLGTSRALTVGALKTHDALITTKKDSSKVPSEAESESIWSDVTSVSTTSTFKTFASDWSHCSNTSFGKLLNNFQATSALQKEMLAVLAAATEIIKSQGGSETSTEYFGVLMTALDVSETEDSSAAIVSLLGMGIHSVPQDVLRLKFSEASKIFLNVLEKYSDGDNFVIVRSVIGCLSVLLRAQDQTVWAFPSTLQVFHSILVFTTFMKPKVRKAAQHAVIAILRASSLIPEDVNHPAAAITAKFCVQKIESSATLGGGTTALHILGLLKDVLPYFPKAHIKTSCESILKLLTLGNVLMTSCCFQALHGLFVSQPKESRLTPTLNAQLIHALYDYQPSLNDWQAVLSWLTVMQEAFCNLARIHPELCAENLLKLFTTITEMWLCDNSKLIANSTFTLRTVAIDCLGKCKNEKNFYTVSRNVFGVVEGGLKYQYHNAWSQVLNLLAALFEVLGQSAAPYSTPCLKTLGDLRDTYNFSYTAELEYTVGKAVRTVGPEIVLKAIPFNITGQETNYEFKRSWILPILRENIQSSSLGFFMSYFLPLANICRKRRDELAKSNNGVGSHSYELLCCQIWALLPSFCNNPNDVAEGFRPLAPILGTVLADWKMLRLSILASLRKLIMKSKEIKNEEGLRVLSRFAKNYLPIMFNIYTTKPTGSDEEGQRLASLDTVKVYLSIANAELCGELFDKAFLLLGDEKVEPFMKESVLDLFKVLVLYVNKSRVEKVYNLCLSSLNDAKNIHEEKKLFRLLEHLCASESDVCRQFLREKFLEVQDLLLKSMEGKNVKHAGARLRCLRQLVRLLPDDQMDAISTIIPEAVLRCKDSNSKTRVCAYDLLTEMFSCMKTWSKKTPDEVIRDYFNMLLRGLLGSPTLASATIIGVTKIMFMLKEEIPADVIEMLLENITTLLATNTREVATSCLSFVKTFIVIYPTHKVLPHLPLIVVSIATMVEDCKRHSRLKIRDILDRLIRKFGYETMKELVPQDDIILQKRLKNLKKINNRKKKGKDDDDNDLSDIEDQFSIKSKPKSIEDILASSDDSDEDDYEERNLQSKKKDRRQKNQMYIQEEEEDIVDLKSPGVSCKLSATMPSARPQGTALLQKKESAFKTTSDGRLIIPRDLKNDVKRPKSSVDDIADSDDEIDDMTSVMSSVKIGKKRKRSIASGSVVSEPASKYQAGGKGIHRPLSIKSKKQKGKNEDADVKTGKEYRSKKAKGDVKLKGKPDPYAYIPLSRKLLNKRKRAKASGKFKNVIKSAVKGAKKGAKAKSKKTK